ncbi:MULTISPECIES: hypothetical protein [unclassified Chamaesiphon]|uniref:hypothetical protein n=1 Tax=unclassified Chamaesiphon TaxID=2620921 RepID=UPI00286AB98A|nr:MULTISPECIES: hypothetical protein [unclassified Chamaesiphon]
MSYNNFTLESVIEQFELRLIDNSFCEQLPPIEPKPEFLNIFTDLLPLGEKARTEKAKSELLVSPILVEARRLSEKRVQLFSGEEFNVDQSKGLNGFCDFLFSRSENPFTIDAPVLMLVEAKRGEIENGLGQCVAEMLAAQRYNQLKNKDISTIYGCVTSGILWQFLKLEGSDVTIDSRNYLVDPVQKILGVIKWMLR